MKINFILPGIGIGGGVRAVFTCSNRLIARGHQVNIIYPLAPYAKPGFHPRFFLSKIFRNLQRGTKVRWFDLKADVIRVPTLAPGLVRMFEWMIPDADITVATACETAYSVAGLSARKGKKLYFVQHYEVWDMWNSKECWEEIALMNSGEKNALIAMADIVPSDPHLKKIKERVDRTFSFPFYKFTTSLCLKELIEKRFGGNVDGLVTVGNDISFARSSVKPPPASAVKILMPYRGFEWKGDRDGLRALEIVKKKYPSIEIVLFGTRKDSNVPVWATFCDGSSDRTLTKLYASCDIFVNPSWVEGFCSPPMEAMACGAACVTTDVGAVREYSVDGKTAVIVPPRKPDLLADAIISLLEDENKRRALAGAGYEYIKQFTWDRAVDQMEDIFKRSLQKNHTAPRESRFTCQRGT